MMPKFWELAIAILSSSKGENLTLYPWKAVLKAGIARPLERS
jgi:hypothetical protein